MVDGCRADGCVQVQDGFLNIALEANLILAGTVIKDVREAVTEELFTLEWEDSNEIIMSKVAMTFQVSTTTGTHTNGYSAGGFSR